LAKKQQSAPINSERKTAATARRDRWLTVAAFFVGAWMVFLHLGALPLLMPDEARNAEIGREMKNSGAWLVPTYNGLPYMDKPAFFFKAVGFSLQLFGDKEAAARLPSAAFAFGLLVLVYAFCRRQYSTRCAALAVLATSTMPLFVCFARIVIFDMTLAFFVCGAIFAGFLAEQAEGRRRKAWYLAGAAAAAVATVVKGPVGFLVPGLVLAGFNLWGGPPGWWKRMFAPVNLAVFFAIALAWFLGATWQRPDFPYYGLVLESFKRFTTPVFRRTQPFYFYGPVVFSGLFAWSLLLPEGMVAAWQTRQRWSRADRLMVVWIIVVLVFFSLSNSKLAQYVLTVPVAAGVLLARMLDRALESGEGRWAGIVARGSGLLAVVAIVIGIFFGVDDVRHWVEARFDSKLPALEFGILTATCAVTGGFALAGWWSRKAALTVTAFVMLPVMVVGAGFDSMKLILLGKDSRKFVEAMGKVTGDTEIVGMECFPLGVPFYLHRYVTVISEDGSEFRSNYVLFTLSKGQPWPDTVVPLRDQDRVLTNRTHPLYVLVRGGALPTLKKIADEHGVGVFQLPDDFWGAIIPAAGKPKN
jgi:4-amino-4-deoxy-L-arabinose transferase-like glycosyltransferase